MLEKMDVEGPIYIYSTALGGVSADVRSVPQSSRSARMVHATFYSEELHKAIECYYDSTIPTPNARAFALSHLRDSLVG